MAIRVTCACGARLKAKDEAAGKRLRCPNCQASVPVPVEPEPSASPESLLDSAWEPLTISTAALSSASRGKRRNPLPFIAGVALAIGVVSFLIFNGREPRQATPEASPVPVVANVAKNANVKAKDDRLRSLLVKADLAYVDDEVNILRIVKIMIDEVKKKGQTLTTEEALEGSLRWPMPGYFAREKPSEFSEYGTMYLTVRTGQSLTHRQTIRNLHYLATALDLKSKQPTSLEFEKAFETAAPGQQLAMAESHNLIRGNDPVAEYYGGLVDQVASAYDITEQEVAAATSYVGIQLQNTSQTAHPDQILLASLRWTSLTKSQGDRPKYLDFLQAYFALRDKDNKSHAQTCEILCGKRPDDARPEP